MDVDGIQKLWNTNVRTSRATSTAARIVIAGAGLGGLTAALALHARGIGAVVLETAREIRPLGLGVNIQPAAVGVLTQLGLGEALAATAIPAGQHLYLDQHGHRLWSDRRGRAAGSEYPQYSVHRGELQLLLAGAVRERLGPGSIRTGTQVRGVHDAGGQARVLAVDRASGTEVVVEAGVVVGADGLHSAVLAQLHPGRVQLWEAGAGMWRGASDLGGFLDGGTMILANDDRGARLIAYPISARHAARGRALVNWVCLVPAGTPGPLRGEAGWNRPARLEEVLPHYGHWDFGWLRVPDLLAAADEIFYYPMADRDPLPSWGRGRVTLLGDAAHLMYPVGANGASQAILDATVLAGTLSAASDIPAALRRYEAVRRPATTGLVRASRDMDHAERAAVTSPGPDQGATLAAIARGYGRAVAASTRSTFPAEPR